MGFNRSLQPLPLKVRHFVVDGELQLQNVVLKRGRAMIENVLDSATTTTLLPCLTISAYKQQQEVFNNYIDHAGASINLVLFHIIAR